MGFVRERPGTNGGTRYQALYDDVKGHRRRAGTFVTESEAARVWQRAEDRQADGRSSDTRRTRQRFRGTSKTCGCPITRWKFGPGRPIPTT